MRNERITHTQQGHTQKRKEDTQVPVVVQAQTLNKQLQRHANHDARGNRKKTGICGAVDLEIGPLGQLEPGDGDGGAEWLAKPAQQRGPEDGLDAATEGHVQRQSHGEALGDVVHEEGHEDAKAEGWVRVVGRVGDEAFGKLVQRDGDDGLEADGEEAVGGHVVVVLGLDVFGALDVAAVGVVVGVRVMMMVIAIVVVGVVGRSADDAVSRGHGWNLARFNAVLSQ